MATSNDIGSSRHDERGRGGHRSRNRDCQRFPQSMINERRSQLSKTAKETMLILKTITSSLPTLNLSASNVYRLEDLAALESSKCPRLPPTSIRVISADSLDAAMGISEPSNNSSTAKPVAVLNMASPTSPGGGWLSGALAQEEAICYRSSLSLSLHKSHYPVPATTGTYTGNVIILRSDYASGHVVWDMPASELPIVSVLSVAGLRRPKVKRIGNQESFANQTDRDLTKDKMRLCLRMAGTNGHTRLVLGALGCGAFRNPKEEVANCWREVFEETEFKGGWWDQIVFAVLDTKGDGNLKVFEDVLEGMKLD